jgi:hypothetical protein
MYYFYLYNNCTKCLCVPSAAIKNLVQLHNIVPSVDTLEMAVTIRSKWRRNFCTECFFVLSAFKTLGTI